MKEKKLWNKDFTLVVIGQIISLFGNAILRFALPLYLLRVSGSAALFGLVSACSFLPMIILSLLGGVLADRVNKRNIMVGLDFSTAAIIVIFSLSLGKIPLVPLLIVVMMLLYGISGTYQPAVQASIPVLVPGEKILQGNAVISQIGALANLLGPIIGGMLYGMWGIMPILLISIVCFLFSAIMEIFIKIPFQRRNDEKGVLRIVKDDLRESADFVKKEKPIFLQVGFVIAGFNLALSSMIIIGIPVLIIDILKMSDSRLGAAQGIMALGGLAGGILTGVLGKKLKIKKAHWLLVLCTIAVAGIGAALVIQPSGFIIYVVIVLMSFFAMSVSTIFTIQLIAEIQIQTPEHLVGKVMACLMAFVMCANPIGQVVYGVLFEKFRENIGGFILMAAIILGIICYFSKSIFQKLEQKEPKKPTNPAEKQPHSDKQTETLISEL